MDVSRFEELQLEAIRLAASVTMARFHPLLVNMVRLPPEHVACGLDVSPAREYGSASAQNF